MTPPPEPDHDTLLDALERAAFGYFDPPSDCIGDMAADNSRPGVPVSIAVVGFALSAYPIAVERGWMTRAEALARSLAALRFFADSDQSGNADATGYKGFYYHFLDRYTGRRVWRSELSMVDTALLIAGALMAQQYFASADADESALRALVDLLYRRIDWRWSQNGGATIMQGWKPECGFLHYGWEGYNEAIVLYVLALGSPSHPIENAGYLAWTVTFQWESIYGYEFLYGGPLFMHQFSHAWIDFRGIRDRFMREKRCDYFENSRRATYVQREYARRNPHEFVGYDERTWGFTACDGPHDDDPALRSDRRHFVGYAARGVPYGPDDGTLAGWGAIASLPFAPDIAMEAAVAMRDRYPEMIAGGSYASSFNPSIACDGAAWVSDGIFGLDQGIVMMMIENHRSELCWRLMRQCPYVRAGLHRAGFRGGWLGRNAARAAPVAQEESERRRG
jgi:hypothetical protein